MLLHRQAREYYTLTIATTPSVTGWEASFDGGHTWTPGTSTEGGETQWLIAGPDCPDDGTPCTRVATSVRPVVRVVDRPEIVIRSGPTVFITT